MASLWGNDNKVVTAHCDAVTPPADRVSVVALNILEGSKQAVTTETSRGNVVLDRFLSSNMMLV